MLRALGKNPLFWLVGDLERLVGGGEEVVVALIAGDAGGVIVVETI